MVAPHEKWKIVATIGARLFFEGRTFPTEVAAKLYASKMLGEPWHVLEKRGFRIEPANED